MSRENGTKLKPLQRREHQIILSERRKFKIHRFRERNPLNVGSGEWIENLLQFMQDPKIKINDLHRWVTNHKWIVAPVPQAQIQTHDQSTSNAFLLPNQHQNHHNHSRNIQNELYVDGSNSILNADGNNGIFQNVPEPGFGFGFCPNAPICSTSTCGGSQPQQHFSPSGSTGNTQTPPVQENFETPILNPPKSGKTQKNVSSCDLLCTMLKAGEDLAKMKHVGNYRGLVKHYEKFYDHVYNTIKSSVLPKFGSSKDIKFETVTIEDNENEIDTVENEQDVQDVQDKDPLQI